jgi:D-alanine-D-alanine ligase-like ATP-grasp enzyme
MLNDRCSPDWQIPAESRTDVFTCILAMQIYPPSYSKIEPDMVINLVDSVKGDESLASAIPGVLELLDFPYTGADILGCR